MSSQSDNIKTNKTFIIMQQANYVIQACRFLLNLAYKVLVGFGFSLCVQTNEW